MFYGRMKNYSLKAPEKVMDAYNHEHNDYVKKGSADIEIIVQDRTNLKTNDLDTYASTLVGYTENNKIDSGWLIDDKYLVLSVMPHRNQNVLYLQEIEGSKL